ncbi:hypothetical protein ACIHFC_33095 [Streptomyces sp. NPDC052013]|uniref:hypothetical protein n=1 Tax=Streptomyces sp. NPDC052013 TaxID=3365679 RepID=UPI0037CF4F97
MDTMLNNQAGVSWYTLTDSAPTWPLHQHYAMAGPHQLARQLAVWRLEHLAEAASSILIAYLTHTWGQASLPTWMTMRWLVVEDEEVIRLEVANFTPPPLVYLSRKSNSKKSAWIRSLPLSVQAVVLAHGQQVRPGNRLLAWVHLRAVIADDTCNDSVHRNG